MAIDYSTFVLIAIQELRAYHRRSYAPRTNLYSPISTLFTPPSAPRYSSPAWTRAGTPDLRPVRDPSNRAAGRSRPTSASCWRRTRTPGQEVAVTRDNVDHAVGHVGHIQVYNTPSSIQYPLN